jgi:hypothetical protein
MVLADSSGPAPLDDDDEKAPLDDEKGANNDESSTADAFFDHFKYQRPSPRESPAGAPVLLRSRAAPTSPQPKNRQKRRNTNVTNFSNRARSSDLKISKSAISLLRAPRR